MEDIIKDNDGGVKENNVAKPKQPVVRYKNLKYRDERKELTKQLLQVLKIDTNNKIFNSYDLDNEETQNAVTLLIPNIEKFYVTTKWCYNKENVKNKKHISVVKSLLKDMDIKFMSYPKKRKVDNTFVSYNIYTITSDIDAFFK
jgi:hypothetical protein